MQYTSWKSGILWKAIQVTLHSRNMKLSYWEKVLPDALHAIKSLLCTTNVALHDRLFNYSWKSTSGTLIPSWAKPGPIYVRNHTKSSKHDTPVTPSTLLEINPHYAHVHLPSNIETITNVQDIASKSTNGEDTCINDNSANPIDSCESSVSVLVSSASKNLLSLKEPTHPVELILLNLQNSSRLQRILNK